MPNIGNDIVDLNLAKTQSNWQRPGFLEKQFTEEEQKIILNSEDSFKQVWLFWSMKEATYKCHVQQFKKRFFSPKKISCKKDVNQNYIVEIEDVIYHLKSTLSNNYIYSVATKKKEIKMVSESFFIDNISDSTKIINQNIQAFFSEEIQIKKNKLGVPFMYQNEKKMAISLSKTHHGNYGAFAFTLENES